MLEQLGIGRRRLCQLLRISWNPDPYRQIWIGIPEGQTNTKSMRIRGNTAVNYKILCLEQSNQVGLASFLQRPHSRNLEAVVCDKELFVYSQTQQILLPVYTNFRENSQKCKNNFAVFLQKTGNYVRQKAVGKSFCESTSDSSNLRIREFAIECCGSGILCLFDPWNRVRLSPDPGSGIPSPHPRHLSDTSRIRNTVLIV